MLRTERISSARESAALAFLARSPYEDVFLTYLILFDVAQTTRKSIYLALDDRDAIVGVAYFGRQTVIATDRPDVAEAFAGVGESYPVERMIVGPREIIGAYWQAVREWHAPPRLVRERQFVMKVDRPALRPYDREVVVRHARIDEWTAVADNSAMMIGSELEYDPRRSSPEFTANVRAMIERGLWWVGESLGRLVFFCNIGPWSPATAQLQGIWTPPEFRGKGLATSALAGICDRLLAMSPTLSLYVNDFNERGIALYERVGFSTVAEFKTILF